MELRSVETVGEYVGTMQAGEDWKAELVAMATAAEADAAWFSAIGGVTDAEMSFYDQSAQSYGPTTFDEPMEVAACTGNIARVDDEADTLAAHVHAVLARSNGDLVAGHLNGATVFVGEVYLRTFETSLTREADATPVLQTDDHWHERLNRDEREVDDVTGLEVWR